MVLSHDVDLCTNEICDICIYDHLPVLFTITLPYFVQSLAQSRTRCVIGPSTAALFSTAFLNSGLSDLRWESVEELNNIFNSTCSRILESIAPLRLMEPNCEPWINETTLALRRQCKHVERKWKMDRLHVSLQMLRDSLITYQQAVKAAKSQYMYDIVSSNSHKPWVLFNVLNSVINPQVSGTFTSSTKLCENVHVFC